MFWVLIIFVLLFSFSEKAQDIFLGGAAIGVFLAFLAICAGAIWIMLVMYFN